MAIEIGQIWVRKDGRKVRITGERISRGAKEFELTPIDKGRKSWKWSGAILYDLVPFEDKS